MTFQTYRGAPSTLLVMCSLTMNVANTSPKATSWLKLRESNVGVQIKMKVYIDPCPDQIIDISRPNLEEGTAQPEVSNRCIALAVPAMALSSMFRISTCTSVQARCLSTFCFADRQSFPPSIDARKHHRQAEGKVRHSTVQPGP